MKAVAKAYYAQDSITFKASGAINTERFTHGESDGDLPPLPKLEQGALKNELDF